MKVETVTIGTEVQTDYGYMILKGFNGYIVYADSFEVEDSGNVEQFGERALTLHELADIMHDVDGKNHKLKWIE